MIRHAYYASAYAMDLNEAHAIARWLIRRVKSHPRKQANRMNAAILRASLAPALRVRGAA